MAPAARVKRFIAPFLKAHPEVGFIARKLVVLPLRHVLTAVDLGRSSDPDAVIVGTTVLPMFHPGSDHISWGRGIARPDGRYCSLTQSDALAVLTAELESWILPSLQRIQTIGDLLAHCQAHENRHMLDFGEGLSIACALGDFDEARRICADWRRRGILDAEGYDDASRKSLADSRELCGLVCADDRAGIIALLHRWEADTAERWGLADIWEPSPFPVESTA
jgi:hypothetical protein